jgi:hypothetical protein
MKKKGAVGSFDGSHAPGSFAGGGHRTPHLMTHVGRASRRLVGGRAGKAAKPMFAPYDRAMPESERHVTTRAFSTMTVHGIARSPTGDITLTGSGKPIAAQGKIGRVTKGGDPVAGFGDGRVQGSAARGASGAQHELPDQKLLVFQSTPAFPRRAAPVRRIARSVVRRRRLAPAQRARCSLRDRHATRRQDPLRRVAPRTVSRPTARSTRRSAWRG